MLYFHNIIKEEKEKEYFKNLTLFIDEEYATKTIFPEKENIFKALESTAYEDVKVVIIGQDPYHGDGQAHGLSFSVKPNIKVPPSLKNIYKELNSDLATYIPNNGYLVKWANQGILLLNSVLTVEKDKPGSHRNKGWETFTDTVISKLNDRTKPIVFVLWGNYAKDKEKYITNTRHLILTSTHPSPFSARNGFFGCRHFSKINEFLKQNKESEIDFQIENLFIEDQIDFL
ncbi:MAG: uracil-DNA glycosylase [Clostridia bacterium]|nr:uracil-DNA glycosylase [Clostridia bacterium]MDD4386909.1 uracil-DNA glycosylase [Clostridia bacterium]